jgi:hypothetical protein
VSSIWRVAIIQEPCHNWQLLRICRKKKDDDKSVANWQREKEIATGFKKLKQALEFCVAVLIGNQR